MVVMHGHIDLVPPWKDESKPIMVGTRPHAYFFDEPEPGMVAIRAVDALVVIEAMRNESMLRRVLRAVKRAAR